MMLSVCGDNDNDFSYIDIFSNEIFSIFMILIIMLVIVFDDDVFFDVEICWIIYGVLYIKVDNLESMVYGVGYVFVKDNLCVLVD